MAVAVVSKSKTPRKFVKERRRNACPACLDRAEWWEGQKNAPPFGYCEVCGDPSRGYRARGYVHEVNVVGFEWRRYPWVIVG